ncbi:MAG: sugar phosphate isomerase/epimerase family protein [Verrucomicrobiota bacterium]
MILLSSPCIGAEQVAFKPSLYPFRNGVKFESIDAGVTAVKELGFTGISSIYPRDAAAFKQACDREGLEFISAYCSSKVHADSHEYGPEVVETIKLLKDTDALIELNVQRGKNPNDEQAVKLVREIADLAAESGLKVVLYPHDGFHISRFDHAVQIARASKRDNVGVIFNLCHFLKERPRADLEASIAGAKGVLWAASTCGADTEGNNWKTLIQPLDQGSFDQVNFLRLLRDGGFNGPVGLQCYNASLPANENLSRAHQAWKGFLDELKSTP